MNNEFTITVTNPSVVRSADNLSLSLFKAGHWLTHFRISADGSGPLEPGASRTFAILFDVQEESLADIYETVVFQVSADGWLVDYPNPTLTVRIEEEAEPVDHEMAETPVSAVELLELVGIEGPRSGLGDTEVHFIENTSGFWMQERGRHSRTGEVSEARMSSVALRSFPREIRLGEAFQFVVEVRERVQYLPGYECSYRYQTAGSDPLHCDGARGPSAEARLWPVGPTVRLTGEDPLCPSSCFEEGWRDRWQFGPMDAPDDYLDLKTTQTAGGALHFTVRFVPVSKEGVAFQYRQEVSGKDSAQVRIPESGGFDFRVSGPDGAAIVLHYRVSDPGTPALVAVDPYEHPPELEDLPPGGTPGEAVAGGAVDESGAAGNETAGALNPADIDPGRPDVAGHIRDWISSAVPPQNVTEGAQFHYDQRGNLVGITADGGIVEARHEQNLPPDSNAVWQRRDRLDSVDHCKLEEYVLAQLQGLSIDRCRGRYEAARAAAGDAPGGAIAVPELTGSSMEEIRDALERAGLTPRFTAGTPASSPAQAGTIASQDPPAGTRLDPGSTIRLVVYGPYNPVITMPDLAGISVEEARARLEAEGLEVRVAAAGAAPSEDLAFRVGSSSPEPGSRARPGDEVTLRIYSRYDPRVVVPAVEGRSFSDARSILSGAGFEVVTRSAGPAPSEGRSGRIQSQEPPGGARVEPGSQVLVRVLSDYVPRIAPAEAACSCRIDDRSSQGTSATCNSFIERSADRAIVYHILNASVTAQPGWRGGENWAFALHNECRVIVGYARNEVCQNHAASFGLTPAQCGVPERNTGPIPVQPSPPAPTSVTGPHGLECPVSAGSLRLVPAESGYQSGRYEDKFLCCYSTPAGWQREDCLNLTWRNDGNTVYYCMEDSESSSPKRLLLQSRSKTAKGWVDLNYLDRGWGSQALRRMIQTVEPYAGSCGR